MPLTDAACRVLNKSGKREKRADGGGLYLLVTPTNAKTWNLAFRFEGRPRTLPLGKYPAVSLAEARLKREQAKVHLQAGRDPGTIAKAEAAPVDRGRLFANVARAWFKAQVEPRRDPKYAARVWSRVEADLILALGDKDIAEITPADVLRALRAIEGRGAVYSARTISRYASGVFRYARIEHGLTTNPAEGLGDALSPRPSVVGQPRLAPADVGGFYAALDKPHGDDDLTRLALELTMHVVLRSGELRGGRWSEIRGNEWHVPGARMKMKRPHIVPLSRQALSLFAKLKQISGERILLFPGRRSGHPISENTILFCIYGLGYKSRASCHGWRATFSTWAHETGRWPSEHIESSLAHADKNEVRRAYNDSEYLRQRREIMQAWSDWLDAQRILGDI